MQSVIEDKKQQSGNDYDALNHIYCGKCRIRAQENGEDSPPAYCGKPRSGATGRKYDDTLPNVCVVCREIRERSGCPNCS